MNSMNEIEMQYEHDRLRALRSKGLEPTAVYGYKFEPYWHQRVIFEFMMHYPNFFLNGEQGVGKTKATIDYIDDVTRANGAQRVLIVSPNSCKTVWQKEVPLHSSYYSDKDIFIIPTGKEKIEKMLDRFKPGYYLINYERVRALRNRGESLANKKYLWDFVVADEASKMKHRGSKQSKAMHEFAKDNKARRFALTGTPITHSPLDLFSIFKFLDPKIYGNLWGAFCLRYANMVKTDFGGELKKPIQIAEGYRNLEELSEKAHSIGVQFKKDECLDLPPKVYVTHLIEMPQSTIKVYADLAEHLIAEIEIEKQDDSVIITAANILVKMLRLRQITSGFIVDEEGNEIEMAKQPKLEFLRDKIEDNAGSKFLVWCSFNRDIRAVTSFLTDKMKLNVVGMSGATPVHERGEVITRFQDGEYDGLVLMTSAFAHGVTLTAANDAYVYSQDMNAENRMQMADRIHRPGQDKKVTIHDLVMENSIDKFVMNTHRKKIGYADAVSNYNLQDIASGKVSDEDGE